MRIWTIHPRYLDRQGLLALWREGLLAQAVLMGRTLGYTAHPQLIRFSDRVSPVESIATYLEGVYAESERRGYRFDRTRIAPHLSTEPIQETRGQLMYEWEHLKAKLRLRSYDHFILIRDLKEPEQHPLFEIIPGEIREWERLKNDRKR